MDFDIQGKNKSPVNTEGWLYTKMLVIGLYMGLVFTLVYIWILLILCKYLFFMIRKKQWLFTSYLQCSCSFLCKWKLLASHTMIFKHWSFHIFFFGSESLDVKDGNEITHPLGQILAVITDSHRPAFRLHNKALLLSNSGLATSHFGANAQEISIDQKGKISLFRRPATWGEGELVSKNQFQRFCSTMKAFKGKFSSVAQLCLTLCDPMDCSMPGFPAQHQLPELTQTQVHQVGDAIQQSHPLSSPSPPAFNLS